MKTPVRFIKDSVKQALRNANYAIVYAPMSGVNGLSLVEDLRKVLNRSDPVCFDVGANEGQTIELLQKAFKNPTIHAFEPASESFCKLKSGIFRRPVSLHNFAMGSEKKRRELINYEDSTLSSFLKFNDDPENRFRDVLVKSKEFVDIRTVDDFVEETQIPKVHILKIDTQGYDLEVLKGATQTIKRGMIDSVLVELNFVKMYQAQANPHEIADFLALHDIHLLDYYEKFRQNHTLGWCTALFVKRADKTYLACG